MVRIINICSGKGGVGKTTVALNLAFSLQKFGKKVVVIDLNLTTPHVGLYLGTYSVPVSLNDFLKNKARLEEAVYVHNSGIKFVPASLDTEDLMNIDTKNLKENISRVFISYDYVLLDSSPGLGRESLISLKTCDDIIFVTTPFIPSVVDVAKYMKLSFMKANPIGIIVNRVKGKNYELSRNDISKFTDLPVISEIPEDESILRSINDKLLVTSVDQNSSSSKAFFQLAADMTGSEYRTSMFDNLLRMLKLKRIDGHGI